MLGSTTLQFYYRLYASETHRRSGIYNLKSLAFGGIQGKKRLRNTLKSRQMLFHWIREGFKLSSAEKLFW